MFELDQVTVRHPGGSAVEGLSLAFAAGSVSAVIGSSGSGKSTLLRLLLGLVLPTSGQVRVEGAPLTAARRQAVRRRIGYVIQEGGLFPHLSALDNLALLPRQLGWSRTRIAERAGDLADLARLPQAALRRLPGELSGGERQRVALMRALMTDPPALLLDEPLGALDPLVRFELQEQVRTLFASLRKTVILVTHDLAEAAYLAPRLVLMRQGRVAQDGSFAELRDRPASDFVRHFVAAQRRLPESTDSDGHAPGAGLPAPVPA